MKMSESELDNTVWVAYSLKEDSAGLDIVIGMDHQRIPRQALHWEVPGFKRGPGRPRTNWRSTVNKDLLRMGIAWKEAEVAVMSAWSKGRRLSGAVLHSSHEPGELSQ